VQRRARLQALLARAQCDLLRFSDSFPDADALLAECSRRGLEGIVAKRKDAPYRSGPRCGWMKVKTAEWRQRTSTARSFSRDDMSNSIVRGA
jgi:bifunctional non-homologous end joining protein LigD